jgi:hypothetical protein
MILQATAGSIARRCPQRAAASRRRCLRGGYSSVQMLGRLTGSRAVISTAARPCALESLSTCHGHLHWRLGQGADHGRMARVALGQSTAPGATSRSTISSASVRLQRLRLACRSGARLVPVLATRHGRGPVLAMHVFGQICSIHFERAPPCQKKRSPRRNRKPN